MVINVNKENFILHTNQKNKKYFSLKIITLEIKVKVLHSIVKKRMRMREKILFF